MGIELEIAVEDEQDADQGGGGEEAVKGKMMEVAFSQVSPSDLAELHGFFKPLAAGSCQLFINSATLDLEFTMEQEEIKSQSPKINVLLENVLSRLPGFTGEILFYT